MSVVSITPVSQRNGGSNNRFHWMVDTFYRAVDAEIFDEPKRLELIYGDLREKEIVNPPHASTTSRIARRMRQLFEPQLIVREEKLVRLANDTEPLPDIAVITGVDEDYEQRHPNAQDVVLLVEVADTTADYDTGEKVRLYANSGINEYWVVLINRRELLVHRNASASEFASIVRLTEEEMVSPLAASDSPTLVRDLLPRVSPTSSVQEG